MPVCAHIGHGLEQVVLMVAPVVVLGIALLGLELRNRRQARNTLAAMRIHRRDELTAFTAPDGSEIRELAHPRHSDARRQSLAEAKLPPGAETREHVHREAEEIYSFLAGWGRLRLGDAEAAVGAGDTVVIPPGTPHKLWNEGSEPLVLLCCCTPAYSDDDTVFTEPPPA